MATERQKTFAVQFVRLGDAKLAADVAGYKGSMPWQLLSSSTIAGLIADELTRVKAEAGAIGYQTAVTIARNEKLPAGARMVAARTLLEFGGYIGKRQDDAPGKDLGELSADQLRDLVTKIDKELGDRARPVNTIESQALPSQLSDMLE